MSERPKCAEKGCTNLAKMKGKLVSGEWYFDKWCYRHKAIKYHLKYKCGNSYNFKCEFDNSTCEICGWNGPCDRHRIKFGKDGGRYENSNLKILCPNCHRLLHLGKNS